MLIVISNFSLLLVLVMVSYGTLNWQ